MDNEPDIVARLRIATLPSVRCVKREAADEIEQLRKDALSAQLCINRLTAERDAARREIMNSVIDQACSNEEIEEEYRKRGWSYLKKENTDER